MNMKPAILICGTSHYTTTDLLAEATPANTIPENSDEDVFSNASGEGNDSDGKPKHLVRRCIETPVATFIEANDITDLDEEEEFPEKLPMNDYVKKIEAELRTRGLLSGDAKIDVVWYCAGETAFMSEAEKDFIRSAAGLSNAFIVASPTIVLDRKDFRKEIDSLTALAGNRRIVLAPSASSGMNFMTFSSGTRLLVEKTRRNYLKTVDASDEDKEACMAAWTDFYGKKFDAWQEAMEEALSDCIEHATGRANFILNKPTDMTLTDLVEEGIGLLSELVDILKGNDVEEDRPGKTDLAHTAELKENIELLIYEIAACYGHAADQSEISLIFRHSKASMLPRDAAAITYAVGQVAKAVYEPEIDYDSKDLLRIYREAKEEALEMEFRPFDDNDPIPNIDEDFELDEEDFDDSDEAEEGEAEEDEPEESEPEEGEPGDAVHEPADELPEDCRPGYEAESDDEQEQAKD